MDQGLMANPIKQSFLTELLRRFPDASKLPASQSLYDLGGGQGRVYIRYSKTHPGNRTFYGLRSTDLQQLEGHHSVICFLWNDQIEPLLVPFADFEDVFFGCLSWRRLQTDSISRNAAQIILQIGRSAKSRRRAGCRTCYCWTGHFNCLDCVEIHEAIAIAGF